MATSSTDHEVLDTVDEHDRVTGTETRGKIHRRGLIHRAVHILVFNPAGRIYIQRRSQSKDRFPGLLDSSAAGHVDSGESYERAAVRELVEELGISEKPVEVLRVPASPKTDNEHVTLYSLRTDAKPRPNPAEITWGGFVEPADLTRMMEENPGDFVPAFILLWREFTRTER